MDLLDPSGENSKIYHEKYDGLTDKEFDVEMQKFFNDDKANLYLEIVEFDRDLKIENIKKCADYMKVPLFERVALPHLSGSTENCVVTPEPVAVGYVHEKRMQQTLLKKNSGSIDIRQRNPKTGQVINEDKNARNTDVETFSLVATGAENALREFMGPRADDMKSKNQMYNEISKKGYVSLDELDNDPHNKVSLNTLDAYFHIQGLSVNLVDPLGKIAKVKK